MWPVLPLWRCQGVFNCINQISSVSSRFQLYHPDFRNLHNVHLSWYEGLGWTARLGASMPPTSSRSWRSLTRTGSTTCRLTHSHSIFSIFFLSKMGYPASPFLTLSSFPEQSDSVIGVLKILHLMEDENLSMSVVNIESQDKNYKGLDFALMTILALGNWHFTTLSCWKEITRCCRMKLWSWSASASRFSTTCPTYLNSLWFALLWLLSLASSRAPEFVMRHFNGQATTFWVFTQSNASNATHTMQKMQ